MVRIPCFSEVMSHSKHRQDSHLPTNHRFVLKRSRAIHFMRYRSTCGQIFPNLNIKDLALDPQLEASKDEQRIKCS